MLPGFLSQTGMYPCTRSRPSPCGCYGSAHTLPGIPWLYHLRCLYFLPGIGKKSGGNILTTGCFMHCRRYFAEAFFLQDVAAMGDEEPRALSETKALLMICEVYQEENKLKEIAADERLFCERGASLQG